VSILRTIEEATVAALLEMPQIESAKIVTIDRWFTKDKDGSPKLNAQEVLPESYPGATVAVDDDFLEAERQQDIAQKQRAIFRVPVWVCIFTTSDGTVDGEALEAVRQLWQDVTLRVMKVHPYVPPGTMMRALKPVAMDRLMNDATTFGVLMKFSAEFALSA
jgi:hypothetical protein